MLYDHTDTIAWPGPAVTIAHALNSDAWYLECPLNSVLSYWLELILQAFGNDDRPFINYLIELWSYQRSDNPLFAHNFPDGKERYGLTLPGKTQMSMAQYNYGDANVLVQALLSHEFGHVVWWWIGLNQNLPGFMEMYTLWLRLRGYDPVKAQTSPEDEECWADDFKYFFGTPAVMYTWGNESYYTVAHPRQYPWMRWFMLKCYNVVQYLKDKQFVNLQYYHPDDWKGAGYWMWTQNGLLTYSSGDNLVYQWQNNRWNKV